jgi:hypothetical protein
MVWILWLWGGWCVCLFGWNNDDARRFSYLLDPKGFRFFGFLIRKVFVSLDPKGFCIFGSKRFSYLSFCIFGSKRFSYNIYLSVSFGSKRFSYLSADAGPRLHVNVSHHRGMNPPPCHIRWVTIIAIRNAVGRIIMGLCRSPSSSNSTESSKEGCSCTITAINHNRHYFFSTGNSG